METCPLWFILNIHDAIFLLNISQVFICCLAFATFSISESLPQNRLQLSFTLVLTMITFKLTASSSLPKISYLTYLVSHGNRWKQVYQPINTMRPVTKCPRLFTRAIVDYLLYVVEREIVQRVQTPIRGQGEAWGMLLWFFQISPKAYNPRLISYLYIARDGKYVWTPKNLK